MTNFQNWKERVCRKIEDVGKNIIIVYIYIYIIYYIEIQSDQLKIRLGKDTDFHCVAKSYLQLIRLYFNIYALVFY